MRKKLIKMVFLLFAIILSIPLGVFAHSGRTDSSGGHKDNKNKSGLGSYHYHHGYNAHLHTNGVCPYKSDSSSSNSASIPTPTPTPTPKQDNIRVIVNGELINFDQPPVNLNGRIMVPVRYVVEKLDCIVEWDAETQSVYINDKNTSLEKDVISSNSAIIVYVNNEQVVFPDQQPVNIEGRILIPIRYVVEKLNCEVSWRDDNQTVYIDKK